jgi:hypothetical protein
MVSHKVYHIGYMEKQKHNCHRARYRAHVEGYYISYPNMDPSQVEVLTLKARCTTTHQDTCLSFEEKHVEV